jgi:hypothetical protein
MQHLLLMVVNELLLAKSSEVPAFTLKKIKTRKHENNLNENYLLT